jgi:hypothetical protein
MGLPATATKRIHLIFKTHLDVGFTDFSANVLSNYIHFYIPRAIELAQQLRESGSNDRFVWTTGSWLIYEYLEQADPEKRKRMEDAIAAGDIAWHALPFTTHSENMSPTLFRFGLSLSKALDQRFGKHTIAAKMTDVPGHTRGIIAPMAEAGVQFLHIGVNAASTPPDVPPVFRWRDPDGKEVMVMYHKGSYGDLMVIPGLEDAIAFAHTGDNLGPQSPDQLHQTYQEMQARFPGAQILASTMDAFAARLSTVRDQLPIITAEFGDTWIHGMGTDPLKEAQYRALLRWQDETLQHGTDPAALKDYFLRLLLVPEHTWGLDLKTHLGDWKNYRTADFTAVRGQENYRKMEASWKEQRGYISSAVDALPAALRSAALNAIEEVRPAPVQLAGFEPFNNPAAPIQLEHFEVAFDPQTAVITHLKTGKTQWSGSDNPLGKIWYETFSAADYQRFYRQYNINKKLTHEWSIPDFTKPGLETLPLEHQVFIPQVTERRRKSLADREVFLFLLAYPAESWQEFGAPKHLSLEMSFSRQTPEILFTLQWMEKSATRIPEASWFSMIPKIREPQNWQMEKLGQWLSPLEVIRDGNRHLHAVGKGIRTVDQGAQIQIMPLDSALVAPGQPSFLNFTNRQPNLRQGFHFNLHNNLWGTNFPMWYEEDARFRFLLSIHAQE